MGLPVRGRRVAAVAGADARAFGLDLAAAFGLVKRRGRHQVLHDGAVDHVFVGWGLGAGGGRFGYDSSEDRVLAGVCVMLTDEVSL